MPGHYSVLFLCTGNSARSIMAEAILNLKGRPNFTAYSAGSHPSGAVRPEALQQLEIAHLPTQGLRSKAWEEFSRPGSPHLDFVFTVCDNAAQEVCPVWPGQPMQKAPKQRSVLPSKMRTGCSPSELASSWRFRSAASTK